jgi:hypothetical protein
MLNEKSIFVFIGWQPYLMPLCYCALQMPGITLVEL